MKRAVGLAAAIVLWTGIAGSPTALAQGEHTAAAEVVQVTIADIPEAGLTGFSGTMGDVTAVGPSQRVTWDGSDPDGVADYIKGWHGAPPGPATSFAEVEESPGVHRAETTRSGSGVALKPDAANLISFGSVHTWAQCTHAPSVPTAEAYAASDSNTAYLFDDLGRQLAEGTQTVETTGAELGLPAVGNATLTITLRHIEETDGSTTAHAGMRVTITAVLYDPSGTQIHDGPLMDLSVGDVTVDCESTGPTTTTTPPPTTTTEPTTSTPPTTTTTDQTTTDQPTPPTTDPTTPPTDDNDPNGDDSTGGLADTGAPTGLMSGLGLLLLAGGALLVLTRFRARR